MTHHAPDTIDLFAGPGGLDLGARWTGLHPIGIEQDRNACATRRAAGLPTIHGDVRDYGPDDFPTATVLLGGPPCQTFTLTGRGTGRRQLDTVLDLAHRTAHRENTAPLLADLTDERTGLVLEPLRWALQALDAGHPYRAIVLEQVPQVLPVWDTYARILTTEGYHTATGVLHAEQHGVPQTRSRAFLLARLDGPVALPAPTHRPYRKGVSRDAGTPTLLPWKPMSSALRHRGAFTVISNYGTGGNAQHRGRRSSSEPAFTVTGKISRLRLIAPDGTELPRLTPAEAGQLQTFPASWPWSGRDIPQQIGNAVPPRLAAVAITATTSARTHAPQAWEQAA